MYHKLRLAVSAAARRPLGLYCQQRLLCAPAAPVVRPLQVLLYTYTEDAVEKRKPFREAHLAAANAAVESGELLLGGALADPVDGGLLIFTGDSDPVAFAESDPYVLNGVVTEWTVREWSAVAGALVQQLTPLVSASNFVPCYEWQFLDEVDFDTLPAGLEMVGGEPQLEEQEGAFVQGGARVRAGGRLLELQPLLERRARLRSMLVSHRIEPIRSRVAIIDSRVVYDAQDDDEPDEQQKPL